MSDNLNNLYIRSITGPDIQNGPGVRLTVWVQGCSHKCPGCHNKDLWEYVSTKGDSHNCIDASKAFSLIKEEIVKKTEGDKYIYDGVTFSGGDPLCQSKNAMHELEQLIENIREIRQDINIWIYTGFTSHYLFKENKFYYDWIVRVRPDVIVDGEFVEQYKPTDPNMCVWRGSTNQRIVDVKKTIETGNITEWQC